VVVFITLKLLASILTLLSAIQIWSVSAATSEVYSNLYELMSHAGSELLKKLLKSIKVSPFWVYGRFFFKICGLSTLTSSLPQTLAETGRYTYSFAAEVVARMNRLLLSKGLFNDK
jgi:hypothetical protein